MMDDDKIAGILKEGDGLLLLRGGDDVLAALQLPVDSLDVVLVPLGDQVFLVFCCSVSNVEEALM